MSYKKWIHKYKFLQEDLIDTQDQFDIYAKTFNEDFSIDVEEDTPQHTNKDSLPDRVSDNLCKPIFKRLSKILHPDKGGDDNDFAKISDNYRNQDIIGLYIIAKKYNIDIEDLITDDTLKLFELSCGLIEEKINNKKKSLAWDWCTTTDPKEKELTIKYLKKNHNIIPKENYKNK
jgi:hypothetical protein